MIFAYFYISSLWIAVVNLQSALILPSTPLSGHVSASSPAWHYYFETTLEELSDTVKNVQIMVGMVDNIVFF